MQPSETMSGDLATDAVSEQSSATAVEERPLNSDLSDLRGFPTPTGSVDAALERRPFNYRSLFWKWHWYAGVLGGPLLALIAVTGAILVFSPEIDHWLRPDLWTIAPPSQSPPWERVSDQSMVDTIQRTFPDEDIIFYRQSERPDRPYQFLLFGDFEQGIHDVWVNPYSGQIVGDRMRETAFVRIVEQLHRRLLSGEVGSSIVELITGWGMILTLTGCYLWWPRTLKSLRHGLTLAFRGSAYKINWRVHNTFGAWTGSFILVMCLTGMVFSTYAGRIYWSVMEATGGRTPTVAAPPQSTPVTGQPLIAVDRVLEAVRRDVPEDLPLTVELPREARDCIVVTSGRTERPAWADRNQYCSWTFDQYSGALLATVDWDDLHPLARFWTISLTLHYGSIFGIPTKVIALIACLAVPVLSMSGYLIWWWKRRGKKRLPRQETSPADRLTARQPAPIARSLVTCLLVVGVLFPTIGVSFIALIVWEGARSLWRRTRVRPVS